MIGEHHLLTIEGSERAYVVGNTDFQAVVRIVQVHVHPRVFVDLIELRQIHRIAQEAVNNALKHAKPRSISIRLNRTRENVTLTVADDGKGIGVLSPTRQGLGLHIMQYRAGLIRGSVVVSVVMGSPFRRRHECLAARTRAPIVPAGLTRVDRMSPGARRRRASRRRCRGGA